MSMPLRALVLAPALLAVACGSSQGNVPEGAHVEAVQTQRLVLHGKTHGNGGTLSCSTPSTGAAPSYFELKEDSTANIALRPMNGVAMLHVTSLATQKTWCAMTRPDGTGATIPGDFASGVYAIDVESASAAPQAYSVLLERL